MKRNENYCLVLSGGGAKGVFHIGVWRALLKLGVQVDAFIGNSIGAVVAGFLAQEEYQKLEDLGKDIGIGSVINIPDEFLEDGEVSLNLNNISHFRKFYKAALSGKGLDTSPWRELLYSNLNEAKMRKKKHDLGVVAYNISDMKPEEIFMEDMPQGTVLEYLIASSAIPGFELPVINGKTYVDGGVYDNIPYTMARKRGYNRIIISDLSGLGVTRKLRVEGTDTVYIKNSIDMGGLLDFNRDFMHRYNMLGYLDTLRIFGALEGIRYFIRPNRRMQNKFQAYLKNSIKKIDEYFRFQEDDFDGITETSIRELFPEHHCYSRNELMVFSDCAATVLGLERVREWTYSDLFAAIGIRKKEVEERFDRLEDGNLRELERFIRRGLKDGPLHQSPYLYYLFIKQSRMKVSRTVLRPILFEKFPELPAAVCFLDVMADFWS